MNLSLRVATTLTLGSSLCLLGLGCHTRSPYAPGMASDRRECTLEMSLPNMACSEACPVKVRGALSRVEGVRSVNVDYETRSAVVEASYPACSADGYDAMLENLYQLGYKCTITAAY